MTTRPILLGCLAAGIWLAGCGAETPIGEVGVTASALTGNCSGLPGAEPLAEIQRLKAVVTGRTGDILASSEAGVVAGEASLGLGGIPVGLDNVLTLLGYTAGAETPAWFGRRRDLSVLQDRTTDVEMVLTRLGKFTCVTPPASFDHRVFSSTTVLGDGRVLITGGFTVMTSSGDSQWTVSVDDASRAAYVYDPRTGVMSEAGKMTVPRGGHASVYLPLPEGDKVLILGGATRLKMSDSGSFPVTFDAADGLNSYELYDVATGVFSAAGNDEAGTPKAMNQKRAFPIAARLFDNTVLITGGGPWPTGSPAYLAAEIWDPAVDQGSGGFLAFEGALLTNRRHAGGAVVKLGDTSQGLSRYLIVGGTTEADSVVEIFTQSSRPEEVSGTFKSRLVPGLPRVFFPTVSRLRDQADGARRFLVAGGATWDGSALKAPAGKAWVLTIDASDGITSKEVADPCLARFMHQAGVSFEGDRVTFLGGFGGFGLLSDVPTCFFDLDAFEAGQVAVFGLEAGQEKFLSRAGHMVERLVDDTLLVVGGIFDAQTLSDTSKGLIELYTPPVLKTDLSK